MTQGPLSGIRVVEFGNLIAAPYAGMVLADLGADVVKVEPPAGDLGRQFGPFIGGESVFFLAVNRGKRSIAIDPKAEAARPWLEKLVTSADVVLNNLRHGAMERMGFDEETVRRLNPGAIYGVISAFGADGPYADRPGIDIVFQAESGMVSVTGHPDDPPQKTATTIGDYVAATNAALTVVAALVERQRTGRGRRIDIALRDGLLSVQSGWWALHFAHGRQPERTGTASPYLAPNQIFATADGYLALAIVSDRHFQVLCRALDRADLAEVYPSNEIRIEQRARLVKELSTVFAQRPTAAWMKQLGDAGLPVGPVLDFDGVASDPQIAHNEMIYRYDHPAAGSVQAVGSPLRVDGEPARATQPPPTLGQHSSEVLIELGASEDQVAHLIDTSVIRIS